MNVATRMEGGGNGEAADGILRRWDAEGSGGEDKMESAHSRSGGGGRERDPATEWGRRQMTETGEGGIMGQSQSSACKSARGDWTSEGGSAAWAGNSRATSASTLSVAIVSLQPSGKNVRTMVQFRLGSAERANHQLIP